MVLTCVLCCVVVLVRSAAAAHRSAEERERDSVSTRDRAQAELEAARRLASEAAADRAVLTAREKQVSTRESLVEAREQEMKEWEERRQGDMDRKFKVRSVLRTPHGRCTLPLTAALIDGLACASGDPLVHMCVCVCMCVCADRLVSSLLRSVSHVLTC